MGMDIGATIGTDGLARELVTAWKTNWEGQRIYSEAYDEANRVGADCEGNDAVWNRMDEGERLQEAGDRMAEDVSTRASAADVDIEDVIYLAKQYLN